MSKYEYYKAMAELEAMASKEWDWQDLTVCVAACLCSIAFLILMVTT